MKLEKIKSVSNAQFHRMTELKITTFNTMVEILREKHKAFLTLLLTILSSYALGAEGGGLPSLPTHAYTVACEAEVGAGAMPLSFIRRVHEAAQAATEASNRKRNSTVLVSPSHMQEHSLESLLPETGIKKQKRMTAEEVEQHKRNAKIIFARIKEKKREIAARQELEALARIEAEKFVQAAILSDTEDGITDESAQTVSHKPILYRAASYRDTKHRRYKYHRYQFCSNCPAYLRTDRLESHNEKCHPPEGTTYEYPCGKEYEDHKGDIKKCTASCRTVVGLRTHQQSHKINAALATGICVGAGVEAEVGVSHKQIGAKVARLAATVKHKKPPKPCDECPYRDKNSNLSRHKITVHPEVPWAYPCTLPYIDHKGLSKTCTASFKTDSALKKHQKEIH